MLSMYRSLHVLLLYFYHCIRLQMSVNQEEQKYPIKCNDGYISLNLGTPQPLFIVLKFLRRSTKLIN